MALAGDTTVNPSLIAVDTGTEVPKFVVSEAELESEPDTLIITATNP